MQLNVFQRASLLPKIASLAGVCRRLEHTGRTTDFGYEDIPVEEKKSRVSGVFESVAPSYDLMNDLMSAGMHRLWKQRFVDKVQIFPGMQHVDVAGGTGDIAFALYRRMREAQQEAVAASTDPASVQQGCVTVCDINPAMISEGQAKAKRLGLEGEGLEWVVGDAESLPFPSNSLDSYTIAFGIRNVTHIDLVLQEAFRVLKPGGHFLCLEFSRLVLPVLRELYDAYSFNVIPKIGRFVANDEASYQYLVESIRRFPDQDTFARMIEDAGFSAVGFENLSGGIVAIHNGFQLQTPKLAA